MSLPPPDPADRVPTTEEARSSAVAVTGDELPPPVGEPVATPADVPGGLVTNVEDEAPSG